ncbi:MAG: leucyl aminopeptidase [Hyphomicrobiaceae bacterium]
MTNAPAVRFAGLDVSGADVVVGLIELELAMGGQIKAIDKKSGGQLLRAAKSAGFSGRRKTVIEVLAPSGVDQSRILMIGRGPTAGATAQDLIDLGGQIMGQLQSRKIAAATVLAEGATGSLDANEAADLALGMMLRGYTFDRYKTKREEGEQPVAPVEITIAVKAPDAANAQFQRRKALAEGVAIARDLVNEPANVLGPVEFAERASRVADLGVEVEVLDPPAMDALKMHALLGVAQGSSRPARMVIMQWFGAENRRTRPVAFIGKGVVFDTGGISMKPAKGMEDMKGDMAGAACVTGLMHALAARKAPVNAVGVIGLVENMPDGNAQRPGDIVRSMSGQTIEVINTDAEGRLVLADALWYVQERFKPKMMVNLATLTGAIMVALGKEYAGLFSNHDRLAAWLVEAGEATSEKLWRMPLDPAYDKEIDCKNADMKNVGSPYGGACTAAAFLRRFVNELPWAHLDIAGTAMGSNRSDVNDGWSSGFGVRLLDRLVQDHYES